MLAMTDLRRDGSVRLTLLMSCLFAGLGVALPFLARWLERTHGLSGVEIAAVISSAQLARIVVGPMIAAWADGFGEARAPIRILAVIGFLAYAGFFWLDGFWALFVTSFVAQSATQAITPLLEGALLRLSLIGKGLPYGIARGIGSVAFIVGNLAGGVLVSRFGVEAAGWLIVGNAAAAAYVALVALNGDGLSGGARPVGRLFARLAAGAALLRRPAFGLPVMAASLIQCSHGFYYGFSTLVWARDLSDSVIGVLWAIGVGVEVALLWTLPRFEKRFTPEALIMIGGGAGLVRWTALAFEPGLMVLPALQALHALTFAAAHVGAIKLVAREAPDEIAGVAQTIYAALASGTLAGLAMLVSGALYDQVGALGYLAMAALSGAGMVTMMFAPRGARRGSGPQPAP